MRFKIENERVRKKRIVKESMEYASDIFTNYLNELLDADSAFLDFLKEHIDVRNYCYSSVNPDESKRQVISEIDEYLINAFKQIKLIYDNCLKYVESEIK